MAFVQEVGLVITTAGVPWLATSVACNAILTCVAESTVTVRAWPPTVAVAPAAKPVPVTVSVKAALPAVTLAGLRVLMLGVGFTGATVSRREHGDARSSRGGNIAGRYGGRELRRRDERRRTASAIDLDDRTAREIGASGSESKGGASGRGRGRADARQNRRRRGRGNGKGQSVRGAPARPGSGHTDLGRSRTRDIGSGHTGLELA